MNRKMKQWLSIVLTAAMLISALPIGALPVGAETDGAVAVLPDEDVCTHTYDNDCDTSCNECGETRVTYHTYTGAFDTQCDVCGAVRQLSSGSVTVGPLTYQITINENGGTAAVSDCDTAASGAIVIPSNVEGCPVTGIGASAFEGCTLLTSIEIPAGVTSIATRAFYDCKALTSITIPAGVTIINNRVFYGCSSLTNIAIPAAVKSIADYAFSASGLTSISLSNSVTGIGYRSFYECNSLKKVWYAGTAEEKAAITVKSGNENLTGAAWQYTVCIGGAAHTYTGAYDTQCNTCGSTRTVAEATGTEGVLTYVITPDANGGTAKITACDTAVSGDFIIPSTIVGCPVTAIGDDAFTGCTGLTSVEIPDSVTSIGLRVFYECTGLMSVNIPAGVKLITNRMFYGCTSLKGIYIPDGVKSIADYAFSGSGVTSIALPATVTGIGYRAFYECANLLGITITDSVTTVGSGAFYGCSSLTDVCYTGDETAKAAITINANNESLTGATWHYNVCTGAHTFIGAFGTKCEVCGAVLPKAPFTMVIDELTYTLTPDANGGTVAVTDCDTAASGEITIVGTVEGCPVTKIGDSAFEGCSGVMSIVIPDSVKTIGARAFCDCKALTCINIPEGVTLLGNRVFYGCSSLKDVTVPNGVIAIGDYAFSASGVESITLPASVTAIGYRSFYEASSLKDVYYAGSEEDKAAITVKSGNECLTGATWHYVTVCEHSYDSDCDADCNECGEVREVAGHLYDHDCDTNCNICGEERITYHMYDHDCDVDCNVCGEERVVEHVYDNACDADCNVCGAWRMAADHVYDSPCDTDCNECGDVREVEHSYDSPCDTDCDICGEWREVEHEFTGDYDTMCDLCGEMRELSTTTIEMGGITYEITPDEMGGTAVITHCDVYVSGDIVIPVAIEGSRVACIGDYAFEFCDRLTSVKIPDSVMTIGVNAFSNCSAMTSVVISDGVSMIGDLAFYMCKGLTSIEIPASVNYIGEWAFAGCTSVTSIIVDEGNPMYYSEGNCLIETGSMTLLVGCNNSVIPDGVTSIRAAAFNGCSGLTSVVLPDTLTYIGEAAFSFCTGLTSVVIPANVTDIGERAFSYCSGLTSVTLPVNLTTISARAFDNCDNLTDVWYAGSESDKANIYIDEYNDALHIATWHYAICEHVYDNACDANCNICGAVREVADHAYELNVDTQPTCLDAGWQTHICTICGDSYSEAIDALGHEYSSEVIAPTCTVEGYTLHTCTRCDDSYVDSYVNAWGHSYDNDCDAECNVCGEEREIEHTYIDPCDADCEVCGYVREAIHCFTAPCDTHCDVCGYVREAADHAYELNVDTQPGCMDEGWQTHTCSACGHSYGEAIAPLGHEHSATVIAPTCDEDGYTVHTCTRCDDTYVDSYVNALGHLYDHDCDADCNKCGEVRVTEHTYDNACDTDCEVCGYVREAADHAYDLNVDTQPTCLDEGWQTHICTACGHSYGEAIAALGHEYLSEVVAPTCTVEGYTIHTCIRCDDTYGDSYVNALGHSYDHDCDAYCNECGEWRVTEHTYDNACDADCNICGDVREVPDHVYDDDSDAVCNHCGHIRPIDAAPTFEVKDATAVIGKTFTVDVVIRNNPGIVSFRLLLDYDTTMFELIGADGVDFSGLAFSPMTKDPFVINWVDSIHPDNTTDGVVVTLTFRVKEDAAVGSSPITVSYNAGDVFNAAYEDVYFATEDGTVTVIDYVSGDVNDDGEINNKDLALLMQYLNLWDVTIVEAAADVNRDGEINNKDYAILIRYINGWDVVLK